MMITVSYKDVKSRLLKAKQNGVLDLLHNGMRYTNYEKVQIFSQAILGTTDITRLNASSFKALLRKVIKDFHVDTVGYHKIYTGAESEVAKINAFLNEAYNELKYFNQEGPDTIDYIPRTEEELKEEQEQYRQFHDLDKDDEYELHETKNAPQSKSLHPDSTASSASLSNRDDEYTRNDISSGIPASSVDEENLSLGHNAPNDFADILLQ